MGILLVDMVSPFHYGRCHYLPAQIFCKQTVSPIRSLFTYLITLFHTGGRVGSCNKYLGILFIDMVSTFYYGHWHSLPAQIFCKEAFWRNE